MSFREDFEAAKVAEPEWSEPVPVTLNGSLYELVFMRAPGTEYVDTTARYNTPREGVTIDLRNGYNLAEVSLAIAPSTARVIDGEERLELDEQEWRDLFAQLAGSELQAVHATIWALNDWNPSQEIERAKKASRAGSKKKSS